MSLLLQSPSAAHTTSYVHECVDRLASRATPAAHGPATRTQQELLKSPTYPWQQSSRYLHELLMLSLQLFVKTAHEIRVADIAGLAAVLVMQVVEQVHG